MTYPHATEDFALGLELKRRLMDPRLNLSTLAELCGIEVRTIRWIRNTKRVPGPMLVAQIGPWWHMALTRKPPVPDVEGKLVGPSIAELVDAGKLPAP